MATEIWVNIGSGNVLLPGGTKPLPGTMLSSCKCLSSSTNGYEPAMTKTHLILINTTRRRQNGYRFADVIFKLIFLNTFFCILFKSHRSFISKDLTVNKAALGQIMAWCRADDKPISEPLLIYITDAYEMINIRVGSTEIMTSVSSS